MDSADLLKMILENMSMKHNELKFELSELRKEVKELDTFRWKIVGASAGVSTLVMLVWVVGSKLLLING